MRRERSSPGYAVSEAVEPPRNGLDRGRRPPHAPPGNRQRPRNPPRSPSCHGPRRSAPNPPVGAAPPPRQGSPAFHPTPPSDLRRTGATASPASEKREANTTRREIIRDIENSKETTQTQRPSGHYKRGCETGDPPTDVPSSPSPAPRTPATPTAPADCAAAPPTPAPATAPTAPPPAHRRCRVASCGGRI